MITITPQGNIYLCKTPLESDYKNQLTFADTESQQIYFNSTIYKTFEEYTYIKKDNTITVGEPIDNIINCNYLFYRNTGFTSKIYYCFITKMEYVNENVTRLYIQTDVFQTYQFDIVYNASFVEREHVNDDTIGLHTVPEGVELGDYIVNSRIDGRSFGNSTNYIVASTIDLSDNSFPNINGNINGGVYNGVRYFHYTNVNTLNNVLKNVADAGKSSAIVCIFQGASEFFDVTDGVVDDSMAPKSCTWELVVLGGTSINKIDKPTTLNGYTPTNKKLLTYPYCYLLASNNQGSNAIYKYEYFSTTKCDFVYYGVLTPGMNIRLYPKDYNNQSRNIDEGLNVGKLPIGSWNTDVYTNWLTQNAVNIGLNVGSSLLSTGVGVATGNPIAVASGILGVANSVGEVYKHSLTPPQVEGNTNNGDVCYSTGDNRISMSLMSIKSEFASIIDKFFTMYGYKVNEVKVPNITGRSNFNYVKTIDNNFDGDIPQEYLQVIKNMFNNGVTLWHNPANMYNYSVSNSIV